MCAEPPQAPGNAPVTSEGSIEVYKAIRAHEIMLNEATSKFEHATVAPLTLLNGGAAVAYLTLLGVTLNPDKSKLTLDSAWVVLALVMWALGLAGAQVAVTYGLKSQRAFSSKHRYVREQVETKLLEQDRLLKEVELQHYGKGQGGSGKYKKSFDFARGSSAALFVLGVAFAAISLMTASGSVPVP